MLASGSELKWRTETAEITGEDFLDVCAMKFVPTNYDANLQRGFFLLRDEDSWRGSKDARLLIFGYPTSLRNVDYDDWHIDVKQIVTSGVVAGGSFADGLHRIEMQRTGMFSSDGLSGGPVFHLAKDDQGFFIGFAGIVAT